MKDSCEGSILRLHGPGTTLQHERGSRSRFSWRVVLFMVIYLFKHLLCHPFLVYPTRTDLDVIS